MAGQNFLINTFFKRKRNTVTIPIEIHDILLNTLNYFVQTTGKNMVSEKEYDEWLTSKPHLRITANEYGVTFTPHNDPL